MVRHRVEPIAGDLHLRGGVSNLTGPTQRTSHLDDPPSGNAITRPAGNGDAHLVGGRVLPRPLLLLYIIPVIVKGLFCPFRRQLEVSALGYPAQVFKYGRPNDWIASS